MGKKAKDEKGRAGLSRRDFIKATAAATAATGVGLDFAFNVPPASAYPAGSTADKHTTCPYCSASCGQTVVVAADGVTVLDIHGDPESPVNRGGLCAKGAGALQLVNNERRLGVPTNTTGRTGEAWVRTGNADWTAISLDLALTEIASGSAVVGREHEGLVKYRNGVGTDLNKYTPSPANYHNSKQVMFFGSSHANNEVNYLYRKMIAAFGTSNTEHQARI
jgi:formate dehydrogenase major subunit